MTSCNMFEQTFRASALAAVLTLTIAGCKKAPIDDATLSANVHTALAGDASIATEPIQTTVVAGVVTLNGNVSNDTARMVASQDAVKVNGVRQVVNNLTIQGVSLVPTITTPEAPSVARRATPQERQVIARHETLPPPASAPRPTSTTPAPGQNSTSTAIPAPAPPPPVIYRNIQVPAGTGVSVRINQTLDSESTQEGATFTGVVTNAVIVGGENVIPAGSSVDGRVLRVHEAGHYQGNSLLSVEITSIRRRGQRIDVASDPYTLEGKGRGKNTVAKVGGGAAVGAILGGIFGGGKGAAIGAAAGAGAGGVANGVTRGQQVQIASESVVRFQLSNGFTVRSTGRAEDLSNEPNNYPNNNQNNYPNNNQNNNQNNYPNNNQNNNQNNYPNNSPNNNDNNDPVLHQRPRN